MPRPLCGYGGTAAVGGSGGTAAVGRSGGTAAVGDASGDRGVWVAAGAGGAVDPDTVGTDTVGSGAAVGEITTAVGSATVVGTRAAVGKAAVGEATNVDVPVAGGAGRVATGTMRAWAAGSSNRPARRGSQPVRPSSSRTLYQAHTSSRPRTSTSLPAASWVSSSKIAPGPARNTAASVSSRRGAAARRLARGRGE